MGLTVDCKYRAYLISLHALQLLPFFFSILDGLYMVNGKQRLCIRPFQRFLVTIRKQAPRLAIARRYDHNISKGSISQTALFFGVDNRNPVPDKTLKAITHNIKVLRSL
jgi:hypothetical protein